MAQRLKRWESPRHSGRNTKGKGGSARARQLKKRQQTLRNRLKNQQDSHNQDSGKGNSTPFPLFFGILGIQLKIRTNRLRRYGR